MKPKKFITAAILASLLSGCATLDQDVTPYQLDYRAVWDHAVAEYRDHVGALKPSCKHEIRRVFFAERPVEDVQFLCRGNESAIGCTSYVFTPGFGYTYTTWIDEAETPVRKCDIAAHEFLHVLEICHRDAAGHDDLAVWGERGDTINPKGDAVQTRIMARALADCLGEDSE